jgi:phosphoribosylanthranilate isomerase
MAIDQATKSHVLCERVQNLWNYPFSRYSSVVQAGADALALYFPPSPRYVSPAQAQQLIEHIPPYVQTVGLFVNASAEEIQTTLEHVALDIYSFMVMKHLNNASRLRASVNAVGIKPFR